MNEHHPENDLVLKGFTGKPRRLRQTPTDQPSVHPGDEPFPHKFRKLYQNGTASMKTAAGRRPSHENLVLQEPEAMKKLKTAAAITSIIAIAAVVTAVATITTQGTMP